MKMITTSYRMHDAALESPLSIKKTGTRASISTAKAWRMPPLPVRALYTGA